MPSGEPRVRRLDRGREVAGSYTQQTSEVNQK